MPLAEHTSVMKNLCQPLTAVLWTGWWC